LISEDVKVRRSKRWEMGDGRWEMGDGRWEMGDGRWEMGDGRWEMGEVEVVVCVAHAVRSDAGTVT
jgi:hypothetical protein